MSLQYRHKDSNIMTIAKGDMVLNDTKYKIIQSNKCKKY